MLSNNRLVFDRQPTYRKSVASRLSSSLDGLYSVLQNIFDREERDNQSFIWSAFVVLRLNHESKVLHRTEVTSLLTANLRKIVAPSLVDFYILSETRMLRNHYFSFSLSTKVCYLLKDLLIVGVASDTSFVNWFFIVLLNFHT